jgi:hypothetical protein
MSGDVRIVSEVVGVIGAPHGRGRGGRLAAIRGELIPHLVMVELSVKVQVPYPNEPIVAAPTAHGSLIAISALGSRRASSHQCSALR